MNSLKAPSLSSLLSGTDRGSSDSLLGSLNLDLDEVVCSIKIPEKLEKNSYHFVSILLAFYLPQIDDFSIPPLEDLPSLDAVLSEIDSDIDSINSSLLAENKFSQTPTPSFDDKQQSGSILRHVIYQGITAQIGSAAVSFNFLLDW